ncbi:hypothetical protein [Paenibacillus sp. 481]|uniref:hypothetical protein n=1 Tax=Paenibacillus sp. 481 TaxID=2835869 RepID=UPI001E4A79FD|nr:hypothetical protein [Paenibacillus sp. 481]
MALSFMMFGSLVWLGLYISNRDKHNKLFLICGFCLMLAAVSIGSTLVLSASDLLVSSFLFPLLCLHLSFIAWLIAALGACAAKEEESQKNILLWKKLSPSDSIIAALTLLLYAIIAVNGWMGSWNFAVEWLLILLGLTLSLFTIRLLIKELKAQGEAWLPDLLRSLDYSVIFTAIFSGQVVVVIQLSADWSSTTVMLLLLSICISVAFQVFVYPIRALLDSIAFATFPKLREERAHLRMVEDVQVRVDEQAEPEEMDEEELYRHTRRALSQFGDLQRLATSPLTQLKLIEKRLRDRGADDDVVERAIELKTVLLESIGHLKPRQDEAFGTADEWRYYNALYYPYIVGIKPYSLRYSADKLDASSLEAFEWFRTYVPERTYYNWQNAGAKLVALRLKEKNAC